MLQNYGKKSVPGETFIKLLAELCMKTVILSFPDKNCKTADSLFRKRNLRKYNLALYEGECLRVKELKNRIIS